MGIRKDAIQRDEVIVIGACHVLIRRDSGRIVSSGCHCAHAAAAAVGDGVIQFIEIITVAPAAALRMS